MNNIRNGNKGFSLIEVILAMTILGMIAVFLFPVFTFSYKQLYRSGNRTEAIYSGQQAVDNTDVENEEAIISATPKTLNISFGSITIPIEGEKITVRIPYDEYGSTISVEAFRADFSH